MAARGECQIILECCQCPVSLELLCCPYDQRTPWLTQVYEEERRGAEIGALTVSTAG